jgi:hypothetical protein
MGAPIDLILASGSTLALPKRDGRRRFFVAQPARGLFTRQHDKMRSGNVFSGKSQFFTHLILLTASKTLGASREVKLQRWKRNYAHRFAIFRPKNVNYVVVIIFPVLI